MDWVRGENLGHGSFGSVSLARTRNRGNPSTPQLMAVKSCAASHSASLMNEKLILDEFKGCPEIIQCYGDGHTFENGERLYNLFLEYASGGALADRLKGSRDRGLPENEVRRYAKGMLRGLNRIHQNGYVHCDIKLQNILLTKEGVVKIADFGLAKRAGNEKAGNSGCELRGTPLYMSPEMVAGVEQSSPADIWAFGCLVAEMVTGSPAWRCADELPALLMRIGVGNEVPEIPGKLSVEGKDFISKCFVRDPRRRWTAEMLLDHPFVSSTSDDGDNEESTVTFKDDADEAPSTSPRSAFEFPDWASQQSSVLTLSVTSLSPAGCDSWFPGSKELDSCGGSRSNSAAERLRALVTDQQPLDWFSSGDWITIR